MGYGGARMFNRPEGIDVSNNNGAFNWDAWRGHIDFAEIKATEGLSFQDPLFSVNWVKTRRVGLHRFAYHYGYPSSPPGAQAKFFTEFVREYGVNKGDNFVLDLEQNDGMKPMDVSFWAYTFCREMNRLNPGHRIIVQTFPAFANEGNCAKLGPWHLWLMDWNVPVPALPAGPWKTLALWQYAEGTRGGPDRDRYMGKPGTLTRFCHTTG